MITMRLAALTTLVLCCWIVPSRGDIATPRKAETNSVANSVAVILCFGSGVTNEDASKPGETTGMNPNKSGQAQTIEELRKRAIEAIRRAGCPIDNDYVGAVNIDMSTGSCAIQLSKAHARGYQVRFNSAGQITSVGGELQPRGEDAWNVDYTRARPSGGGVRLAIALTNNVLIAGTNSLLKCWLTNDSATRLSLAWGFGGPDPGNCYLEIWLKAEGGKEYVLVHGPGNSLIVHRGAERFVPGEVHSYRLLLPIPADIPLGRYQLQAKRELHGPGTEVLSNSLDVEVR
jgi:hypothetical protein